MLPVHAHGHGPRAGNPAHIVNMWPGTNCVTCTLQL